MFEFSREDIASLNCIRLQREAMGMSVSELARRVGASRTTIHNIEQGLGNPQWATVLAILAELGIGVSLHWVGLPMLEDRD